MATREVKYYRFFWTPERRYVFGVWAKTITRARAVFKQEWPGFASFMKEIHIEVE